MTAVGFLLENPDGLDLGTSSSSLSVALPLTQHAQANDKRMARKSIKFCSHPGHATIPVSPSNFIARRSSRTTSVRICIRKSTSSLEIDKLARKRLEPSTSSIICRTKELSVRRIIRSVLRSADASSTDLDAIEDENERQAATSTIHNFGMTPRQLFTKPHPARIVPLLAKSTIPLFSPDSLVEQQSVALVQCIVPVTSIGRQVGTIQPFDTPDKTIASPSQSLFLPTNHQFFISWGFPDRSLRLFSSNAPTSAIDVYEGMQPITACCFADSHILVTGSTELVSFLLSDWTEY